MKSFNQWVAHPSVSFGQSNYLDTWADEYCLMSAGALKGSLRLVEGRIVAQDEQARSKFGEKGGQTVESLFAHPQCALIKLCAIADQTIVEARLIDKDGRPFWARLWCDQDQLNFEDIDQIKSFLIDYEDLCEEQERNGAFLRQRTLN